MFQKLKEYFLSHPNSGVFSTFLFSIATMSTEEKIAMITAIGMLISGLSSAVLQHSRWKQERKEKNQFLEIEKLHKEREFKKFDIENERLELENKIILHNFEANQKS